jgi:signal peptidase I
MADRIRFYRGSSMNGTFRPGDCLWIESARVGDICSGDVVVFLRLDTKHLADCDNDPEEELRSPDVAKAPDELVHRVVRLQAKALITQGDNNPCEDPDPVTADNLVGRVFYLERGKRRNQVHGGRVGLFSARFLKIRRSFWQFIAYLGRLPYGWLRSSGLATRLWKPPIDRVFLKENSQSIVKFVCHGQTVARWWPQSGCFECRKPYDLVLRRNEPPQPE